MAAQRFAIIGAGMAGMACAHALAAKGKFVVVFEKSRGLGGRMSTRRGDTWQCDHGAQYFTARDPQFRQQVAHWVEQGIVQAWQARIGVYDETGWRQLDDTIERFVGVPGMNAPVAALAGQIEVRRGTQIAALARGQDGWQLLLKENGGRSETFDAVVLAMPAPQALALAAPWSATLAAIAQSVVMLPSWALMAQFEERPLQQLDAAFINLGPIRWLARQASKPGRPEEETWLIHANAAWSCDHLEAQPSEIANAIIDALKQLGMPEPSSHEIHRWRYADIESPLTVGSAFDRNCHVGLCGDWLCGGKVEGAWLSGRHLAASLA